jgi:hypothetical protein
MTCKWCGEDAGPGRTFYIDGCLEEAVADLLKRAELLEGYKD